MTAMLATMFGAYVASLIIYDACGVWAHMGALACVAAVPYVWPPWPPFWMGKNDGPTDGERPLCGPSERRSSDVE